MNEFSQVGQTAVETMSVSKQALLDSFSQAWSQVILLAPKMVAMVVVLVVGYVLAMGCQRGCGGQRENWFADSC